MNGKRKKNFAFHGNTLHAVKNALYFTTMKNEPKPVAKGDRSHARSASATVLGVSMTSELKAKIKAAAEKDGRTMANFCAHYLRRAVEQIEGEKNAATMIVGLAAPKTNGGKKAK